MTSERPQRLRRMLRAHGLGLCAIVLCTVVVACAVTHDGAGLLATDRLSGYFDALADSLRQGRFDVPREAIDYEAFIIDGRTYGYFGPTPALVHGALNALWPSGRGRWARTCMILCAAFTAAVVYGLAKSASGRQSPVARMLVATLVLTSLFATPLATIAFPPIIYHESISFGISFCLATYGAIVAYERSGRRAWLGAALLLALLAFQSRTSIGAGAMLAVSALLARDVLRFVRAAIRERAGSVEVGDVGETKARMINALGLGLVFSALALGIIYKNVHVFGNISGMPSLSHHVALLNNPARAARTNGGQFVQPANFPANAAAYLHPASATFRFNAPFIFPRRPDEVRVFPETRLDHREGHASLTATTPAFVLLALLGIYFAFFGRRPGDERFAAFRLPMIGAFVGGSAAFIIACITQRYLGDSVPFLVVGSIVGTFGLWDRFRDVRPARYLALTLIGLLVYSTYASTMIAARIAWG